MKKYFKVLILLLAVTLCLACNKKKEEVKIEPFDLPASFYEKSEITDIELDKLNELIDNKESFIVYVYLPGCSSCAAFKEVLEEFQKTNTLSFYATQIKYAKETEIGEKIKYAPSFVVFKEGKVYGYLDAESDKDKAFYESAAEFKNWITKYINIKES